MIPVQLLLIVDQRKLPDLLAGLTTIEFSFVVKEIAWSVLGQRLSVPTELESSMEIAPGIARETINNAVQLLVNAEMMIYEMPAELKQKWEAERQAAQGAATPMPPGAPPPAVPKK
jgi:hypothetical protein